MALEKKRQITISDISDTFAKLWRHAEEATKTISVARIYGVAHKHIFVTNPFTGDAGFSVLYGKYEIVLFTGERKASTKLYLPGEIHDQIVEYLKRKESEDMPSVSGVGIAVEVWAEKDMGNEFFMMPKFIIPPFFFNEVDEVEANVDIARRDNSGIDGVGGDVPSPGNHTEIVEVQEKTEIGTENAKEEVGTENAETGAATAKKKAPIKKTVAKKKAPIKKRAR